MILQSLLMRAFKIIERWIGELRGPDKFEETRECSLEF